MKKKLITSIFLVSLLTLYSCSSGNNKGESRMKSLDGSDWILKSLNDKKIFTPESGKDIFIRFNSKENRFSGFAGCNNISGTYSLTQDKIKFGPVLGTEMYCESRMEDERNFMIMFGTIIRYEIKGNDLFFYDDKNSIAASFKSQKNK